jgi:carbon storage regulator
MLILTRKKDEAVLIKGLDGEISVKVVDVGRGRIRLGIEAPKGFLIVREELIRQVESENQASAIRDIDEIRGMMK